jgi:hypothetical protein
MNPMIAPLILALVGGGLAGCSNLQAINDSAPYELEPDYHRIISQNLELGRRSKAMKTFTPCNAPDADSAECSIFVDPEKLNRIEISGIRRVKHDTKGWAWLTCLRAHPERRPPVDFTIEYAIFIANKHIVDTRMSVGIDNCTKQVYEPL